MLRPALAFATLALLVGVPARSWSQAPEDAPNDAEAPADTDSDADPDADGGAGDATAADEPPAQLGKVAVVVAGDPDEALRGVANAIDEGLSADGIQRPSDAGLRAALRGEPSEAEDGLERVRRERRGLGFGEDDRPTLARLGRMAGADAVVVVSRQDGTLRAEVFDVHAERFYRDRLDAEPVDAVVAFTARAARAAHRRAQQPTEEPTATTDAEPEPAAVPSPEETANAAVEGEADDDEDDDPSPARQWFRKNWAFILAGALLAGVVAGFVIRARRDDPGADAVILFRPGE